MKQQVIYLSVLGITLEASDALNYCCDLRNQALKRARQYRDHDLPWFKAHDPAEYEMQMLKNPVSEEVLKAWTYHRWAMRIHDHIRSIPTQATLF